ncbi:MAG: hypothetical protein NVS1B6_08080 [Steroidobacteraceae bacterium]
MRNSTDGWSALDWDKLEAPTFRLWTGAFELNKWIVLPGGSPLKEIARRLAELARRHGEAPRLDLGALLKQQIDASFALGSAKDLLLTLFRSAQNNPELHESLETIVQEMEKAEKLVGKTISVVSEVL